MGVSYDKAEKEGMAADGGTKEPIERRAEVNFVVKAQADLRRIEVPINLYSSFGSLWKARDMSKRYEPKQ